jgi:hypothetical protein
MDQDRRRNSELLYIFISHIIVIGRLQDVPAPEKNISPNGQAHYDDGHDADLEFI